MKQRILKEISNWPFELLSYAFSYYDCETINELVENINKDFPCKEDLTHIRSDVEYAMQRGQRETT